MERKGLTYLLFHKVPDNTFYTVGNYSWVTTEVAKTYIKEGYASAYTPTSDLPDDIPHRDLLIEGGVNDIQDVQDLTKIKGIGKAKAKEIEQWKSE